MANKKKLIGLGIGLVCVVLLVVLLLTRCGGNVGEPDVPETSAPADVTETAAPTEAATEAPTEAPTEPVEETLPEETEPVAETEPVEETEPEEESQGSSSGGNSRPGGTGGFTGSGSDSGSSDSDEEGEGESGEAEQPADAPIADPGTETNAYTEVLGQIPDEISTVKIPAEQTIYYNVYNAGGSVLTIEDQNAYVVYNGETYQAQGGAVTVELEADANPVSLQIGSTADKEQAYTLKFAMPVGTEQNPEALEDISHILVTLPEGHNGHYYYRYDVIETGTLSMNFISMDPEDGSCQIELTRIRTGEDGETTETFTSVDGVVSVDVEYGDVIIMHVVVEPPVIVAEIYIQGNLDVTVGTIDNPILLNYPEDTMVIPAGKTVYYTANVAGASMTVTGENVNAIAVEHNEFVYVAEEDVISLEASASGRGSSCVFAVTNSSHEAVTCSVAFAYPVGHSMNPAELLIGSNTAAIEEGSIGYYYGWTATQAGDLTITIDAASVNGWFFSVSMPDSGVYGENHYDTDETPVTSETISVVEGDVVEIIVNTNSDTGIAPAGDVVFTAEFAVGAGTEENPYLIVGELEADLTVGAGETMWVQCRALSMIFTLEGSEVEVAHDGQTHAAADGVVTFPVTGGDMYNPPLFAITNLSAEEKTYHVAFTYPVGTSENPQKVAIGENSVELEKDSTGYFYGFTAEEDGSLTITMDAEKNTAGWLYCINNITTETYGMNHYSDEEEPVPSETVEVKAGDEIQIVLGTYAPGGVAPAGTVYFTAEFVPAVQTDEPEATEPEATEPEVTEPEATESEVSVAAITALAVKEEPLGSSENPDELLLEENSVKLDKDSTGYFYSFIAEEDGFLTITMMDEEENEDGWMYCISNLTTETEGENHYSETGDKDKDPVPSETVEVSKGDEIQIMVGTYVYGGASPAGEVCFTAEFITEEEAAAQAEQATAAEAEAAEPEATEPEIAEPEVTEPEVTEPEATEPEVTEPEATEPEVAEPEVTEPEVTEPEVAEPEATEPEVTEPEVTEPEVTEPEVTEPEVTEPEATEPEVTEPEVTEAE